MISDNPQRGTRLARDLSADHPCLVHDLYEDSLPELRPRLIISDISLLNSETIVRLRRCLEYIRSSDVPFLFLTYGNVARAEVHAKLLHATAQLPAALVGQCGLTQLRHLDAQARPISALARKHGANARSFLQIVFFGDRAMTPETLDQGTDLITRAVREVHIRDWVAMVQRFDDVTHQHILLVAGLATAFADALGLNRLDQHRLTEAALLHDVGKTKVPSNILNKPGKLDQDEMEIMRSHASLGYEMLVNQGFTSDTLSVVRSHHEMLDGSGYPDGMKGAAIPDLVRVVTVCDIFCGFD